MTTRPKRSKWNTATAPAANKSTKSGSGNFGATQCATYNSTSTTTAISSVGICASVTCWKNDTSSCQACSPSVSILVISDSWLIIISTAIPMRYPTSTGRDNNLVDRKSVV